MTLGLGRWKRGIWNPVLSALPCKGQHEISWMGKGRTQGLELPSRSKKLCLLWVGTILKASLCLA